MSIKRVARVFRGVPRGFWVVGMWLAYVVVNVFWVVARML